MSVSAHGSVHFQSELEDVAYVSHRIRGQRVHRPFPRQLAQPGEDPQDPDQRRQEDARLGRPLIRREDQDLRPGRRIQEHERQPEERHPRPSGQLPLRRHVRPEDRQHRGPRAEVEYFVRCLERNEEPFNNGQAGLQVVRILEAADQSIKNSGQRIKL